MTKKYEDAMDYAVLESDLRAPRYQDSCPECGYGIVRAEETGEQIGRCFNCGHSEHDDDYNCDPTKELDFND